MYSTVHSGSCAPCAHELPCSLRFENRFVVLGVTPVK